MKLSKPVVTKMMKHIAFVALYRAIIRLKIMKLGKGLDPIALDDFLIKFSLEDKYVEEKT